MLTNYHTHSTFCDGKNTPEEIVLYCIDRGFDAIGFSGHGHTAFDQRYCMKDPSAFREEIRRLQQKYAGKMQIYLGSEEDVFAPVDRNDYQYLITSCHYFCVDDVYYPIDSGWNYFSKCLEVFKGDIMHLATTYYEKFCPFIVERKPDIIGHFDLITKFDEMGESMFFSNPEYNKLAEKYTAIAASSGSLFEVNTGAISRGYRKTPYPAENLLHLIKKLGNGLVLSSDSHQVETLDFEFEEARRLLKDVGFRHVYSLYDGKFVEDKL